VRLIAREPVESVRMPASLVVRESTGGAPAPPVHGTGGQ